MKKFTMCIALILALSMMLCLFAGCAKQDTAADTSKDSTAAPAETTDTTKDDVPADTENTDVPNVRIGAFYNLSGSGADTGNQALQAAQMAADYINGNGGIQSLGGAKIEIVPADTMSDTSQAKAVADRILADDTIIAGIGLSGSAYGIPMLPAFEKAGVPLVENGIADEFTTQGYSTVFQFCCTSTMFGAGQVDYINYLNNELGYNITKFGALYEDTEAGVSAAKTAKEKAEAAGYEWVYDESYTLGALTDASSMVVSMKQSGVQVVFITARDADIKIIVNAMQSLNYMPMIFGSGAGFLFPSFAQELGDSVEGIISVATSCWDISTLGDDGWATVPQEYEDKYGYFISEHANGGYSAVRIIAAALEKSGSYDSRELCDALREIDIDTFCGPVKFDETGKDVEAVCFVIQWQKCEDGEYRPCTVYPAEYAGSELQVDKLSVGN